MAKKKEMLYEEKIISEQLEIEDKIVLNEKEEFRRNLILTGGMYKTIIYISMPVAIYNLINQFLNFLNSLIVANLGKEVFSMVSYISTIQFMLTSLGAGLSVGGGILIAKYYGEGDYNKTKDYITNLNLFTFFVCILLILCTEPFAEAILRASGVDANMISTGAIYFRIEVMSVVWMFINQIYMTIEKARGNTKKIMYLNFVVVAIKLVLSYIFVKIMGLGVISVAIATFISHFTFTLVAFESMLFNKSNPFRMRFKGLKVRLSIVKEIFVLSFPIIFEKVAFSFGKVYVNTLGSFYSPTAVGALGVSNQICGIGTTFPGGFQSGETTVISQNIGNKNVPRAIDAFKVTLIINIIYSIISVLTMLLFTEQIVNLYAKTDVQFANEIRTIFQTEVYATIMLNISTTILGLLYGFGHTFIALIINMLRIFVFRIPVVLYFVNYTNLGIEALGYSMFISNTMVGIISIVYAVVILRKISRKFNVDIKGIFKIKLQSW